MSGSMAPREPCSPLPDAPDHHEVAGNNVIIMAEPQLVFKPITLVSA